MAPRRTTPDLDAPDTSTVDTVDTAAPPVASEPDPPVDEPGELVTARYVGVDPVHAVFDGVQQIIEPGDPITVTAEQLAQNPVFEPWED